MFFSTLIFNTEHPMMKDFYLDVDYSLLDIGCSFFAINTPFLKEIGARLYYRFPVKPIAQHH
jgi:hypothetical protein